MDKEEEDVMDDDEEEEEMTAVEILVHEVSRNSYDFGLYVTSDPNYDLLACGFRDSTCRVFVALR
jgi:hypothetical protein